MKKSVLLIMPNVEKGGIEKNLILLTSYLVKNFKITLVCGEISGEVRKKNRQKSQNYYCKKLCKKQIFIS